MRLALFDFDGTLTTRDSLLPFLHHAVGKRRLALGMLAAGPMLTAYALKLLPNDVAKQALLASVIGGMPHADLQRLGDEFALSSSLGSLLRASMMDTLSEHLARGDECVLVSASLDVYLEPWARAHGMTAVLCSRLASDGEGRVTGQIDNGNCFGPMKQQRIREWLAGRQPEHITAYGDSRGDREMLALADDARWIGTPKD